MSTERAPEKKTTDGLVGELLASRYLIERKLGEGAMGAVYRARHVKVGRPFAVKVLHRKLLEDKKIALRFEREAELAGRLHHPNVVGVVDVGETTDGMRYMVMDFCEGSDLADLLSEAPMPPQRVIHLTRQLLEGLYHAHEAGLIHRDFKPENILVERDDHGTEVPRIVDFGISILREGGDSSDSNGRLTTNGLVLGTPHYMAPEQAVADPIDHRIDLFALGIVIYEMLCGKLPFDGAGAEVARANLLLDPPPISQRVPYLEVDPLLEAFARRLMSKKRDHRPATAKKARELLDLIEKDRPAAAAALGLPHETGERPPQLTQPVSLQAPVPIGTQETAPAKWFPARPPAEAAAPTAAGGAVTAPNRPVSSPGRRAPSGAGGPEMQYAATAAVPSSPMAAVASPSPSLSMPATTSTTEPLPWRGARSSKRRALLVGGIGVVAIGAALALTLGGSGGGDAKPAPEKVATAAPPVPAPVPVPTEPTPPVPAPSEIGSGAAAEVTAPETPPDPALEMPPEQARPSDPTKIAKANPTRQPKPRDPKPAVIKPEIARPAEPKPPEVKVVPLPPSVGDPASSAASIEQEWRTVRAGITALEKSHGKTAAERAFGRWRLLKIAKAQQDAEYRQSTAGELAAIRKIIAEEQKK